MEQQSDKFLVATYGSLRKDQYNFDRFKRMFSDGYNYLKTTSILGYEIFDLGSYPGLRESTNPEARVIVDIMECNPSCFKSIEGMEHDAGYSTITVTDENSGEEYLAYRYDYSHGKLVESGDWSKYLKGEIEVEA